MMVLLAGNARQRGGATVKRMQLVPAVMLLAVIALVLGGCSSAAGPAQPRPSAKELALAQEKQAVLQAWVNAEEAGFALSQDGPPPGFLTAMRALQPGIAYDKSNSPIDGYFSSLSRFEIGKALAQDMSTLVASWSWGLRGPSRYNLGKPTVTLRSRTDAVVRSCVWLAGWSIPPGNPPSGFSLPSDGAENTVTPLSLIDGSWYVTGGTNTVRSKPC